MVINDREVGFYYSVGALCDFNDWMVLHPKSGIASARMNLACMMNKAYHDEHPEDTTEPITVEELRKLPRNVYSEIDRAISEQEKADTKRSVETEPKKGKNAKTAQS